VAPSSFLHWSPSSDRKVMKLPWDSDQVSISQKPLLG
jgi:hypothetical protein